VAIRLANEVGLPLLMAGKIDPGDREYFTLQIEPLLGGPEVAYLGDVTDEEKESFLGNAMALLAPGRHASSEYLSFIEALACGTPVITMAGNSHAEFIEHGITGYTCATYRAMVHALREVAQLDRSYCRDAFEANFSLNRMVEDYLAVYETVIGNIWSLAGQS
jgi:glycosyltransferase involved in cell wall biosynthesis